MTTAIFLAFLVLGALLFVLAPLRRVRRGRLHAGHTARVPDLQMEKKRILGLIRDLEFDREVGKILEEDYTTSAREYKAQAVRILDELDALMPKGKVEAWVDEEIARVKAELNRTSAV